MNSVGIRRTIKVYNTHIEVYPYMEGERRSLEEFYSVYDNIFHKWIPVAYTVLNDTLYLPRGTNIGMLEKMFHVAPITIFESDPSKKIKIKATIKPKSRIQEEAIEFLCGEGRFTKANQYNQLGLNLDTGDGKTIAAILAIAKKYKCKTIIILYQTNHKMHWIEEFKKASNVSDDALVNLVGSEDIQKVIDGTIKGDIYFTNHHTIHSYAKRNGWPAVVQFFKSLNVGLKIYDEAHKYFNSIMMIDFFSNTAKTFYLTATATRADYREQAMYKRAFANTYRFGEETRNYEEKRRHVIYYYVTFNSHPDPAIMASMYNKYSISPFKYIEYAMYHDDQHLLFRIVNRILELTKNLEGKTLITTPLIESTEYLAKYITTDKTVSVINSNHTDEENEEAVNADIISSTMKSLGTGIDIKRLRIIINTEPFSSDVNMTQLKGRLREFSPTDDTYLFDLVDTGFTDIKRMGDKRLAVMKRQAKEVKLLKL